MRWLAALALLLMGSMASAQAIDWPDTKPGDFVLAHIDVETTGLDPARHEIVSIGMIYTDLDGREIDRLDLTVMPPHPERIDAGAAAVNGFNVALWRARKAVTEAEAARRLAEFHRAARGGRTVLFTAYNSWFDQAFLSAMLKRQGVQWRDLFHYHVLDIPSMAWGLGLRQTRGSGLAAALGVPDETRVPTEHTGITGAAFNVSIYRALRARLTRSGSSAR